MDIFQKIMPFRKIFRRLLTATLMVAVTSLTACEKKKPDIQQNFPFEVSLMPVPKEIRTGETVEIRIKILPSGNFRDTKYFIRYFQFEGSGELRYFDSDPYLPNDLYLLESKVFRLYYTSTSAVTQSFDVWISDNFDNEQKVSFEFKNSD